MPATNPAPDIFAQIAQTSTTQRGNNYLEGSGVLVLNKALYEAMNEGPTFVAEHIVVQSAPNGLLGKDGKPSIPNAPGSTVSAPQKTAKHPQTAPSNIKSYICALAGVDPGKVISSEEHEEFRRFVGKGQTANFANASRAICSDEQVAKGMLVGYETYRQATRNQKAAGAGDYNVYPRFKHIAGQTDDEIFARREALERGETITL